MYLSFDTSKLLRLLENAKIESNQTESVESLLGYEHSKRPFTRKYFDTSKDNEFDNLFIVDKNTSIFPFSL